MSIWHNLQSLIKVVFGTETNKFKQWIFLGARHNMEFEEVRLIAHIYHWKQFSEIMVDHSVSWLIMMFHDWSFFSWVKAGQLSLPIFMISWSTCIRDSHMSCAYQSLSHDQSWSVMTHDDATWDARWDAMRCEEMLWVKEWQVKKMTSFKTVYI